jgi:hypothetical protein
MEVMTDLLTKHFTKVQNICSKEQFPLALYIVLCQALRNELNISLNQNGGEFSRILGPGAAKEVATMITSRFNMDGLDPSGRKVGLLDRHHLWAFLVDPFNHELRSTFLLQANVAVLMREMIEAYVPLDADGSSTKRDKVKSEFMVSVSFNL